MIPGEEETRVEAWIRFGRLEARACGEGMGNGEGGERFPCIDPLGEEVVEGGQDGLVVGGVEAIDRGEVLSGGGVGWLDGGREGEVVHGSGFWLIGAEVEVMGVRGQGFGGQLEVEAGGGVERRGWAIGEPLRGSGGIGGEDDLIGEEGFAGGQADLAGLSVLDGGIEVEPVDWETGGQLPGQCGHALGGQAGGILTEVFKSEFQHATGDLEGRIQ